MTITSADSNKQTWAVPAGVRDPTCGDGPLGPKTDNGPATKAIVSCGRAADIRQVHPQAKKENNNQKKKGSNCVRRQLASPRAEHSTKVPEHHRLGNQSVPRTAAVGNSVARASHLLHVSDEDPVKRTWGGRSKRIHARQYVSGTLQYLGRRRGGRQLVRLQRSPALRKRAASKGTRCIHTLVHDDYGRLCKHRAGSLLAVPIWHEAPGRTATLWTRKAQQEPYSSRTLALHVLAVSA